MRLSSIFAAMALLLVLAAPTALMAETPVVEVDTDQFERGITLLGPEQVVDPYGETPCSWRLRSWVDKNSHAVADQLYVEITYAGHVRRYETAMDDNADDLSVTGISRTSTGSCRSARGCVHTEIIGVALNDATLRARQAGGYRIKVKAKSGDSLILPISPTQIGLQIAAIDRYVADPASAALAVPQGESPRDAEFGVTFSEPFGWVVRMDARHLNTPDLHEAMAVSIRRGSIAQKAGLHWADCIYEFDGQPIQSIQHLLEMMRAVPAGRMVEFKALHNGHSVTLEAQF